MLVSYEILDDTIPTGIIKTLNINDDELVGLSIQEKQQLIDAYILEDFPKRITFKTKRKD